MEHIQVLCIFVIFCVKSGNSLECYECAETFVHEWMPTDCQVNVSAVPSRVCNKQQAFCFVASSTVKRIWTSMTRGCVDQCFYGCVASDFGVTAITCTSCCDEDMCNTGNVAAENHRNQCSVTLSLITMFNIVLDSFMFSN